MGTGRGFEFSVFFGGFGEERTATHKKKPAEETDNDGVSLLPSFGREMKKKVVCAVLLTMNEIAHAYAHTHFLWTCYMMKL